MLQRIVVAGVLHLLDRPDILWADPVFDAIYNEFRASFDLEERFHSSAQ